MKKRIIISLLCGLVICCTAAYSFGTTGIVNTDTLRLRSNNSTNSSIITLLSIDEKVEILTHTDDGWYKVKYVDTKTKKEYEGYVSEQYVNVKNNETIPKPNSSEETKPSEVENNNPPEEVDTNEEVEESTTKIINKGEKVYIIPLINSNTTKILESDLTVEVMEELNGWSYVTSNEFKGWVRTEKLKDVEAKKKVGYINTTGVNFREQPTTSSKSMLKFERNTEVKIIEENNGWTKIEYQGKSGYITTNYISDSKIQTTSRGSSRRTAKTETSTTSKNANTSDSITNSKVPSNANSSEIIAYARQFLGYKYVYGGCTPSGFDCSGFTQYVYKHFGYSLSRTSNSQARNGIAVNRANLELGDIICFSSSKSSKKVTHVGIYIGGGRFIHAANERRGVITSSIDGEGFFYVCARRIV